MSLEPQPDSQAGQIARSRATIVPSDDRLTMMDVWRVLMKQRFIILAVAFVSLATAAIYSFRTKPVYESVSRIEINPNNAPNVGLQSLIEEERSGEGTAALQTEILVLQSDSVMLQTAQSLGLIAKVHPARLRQGSVLP
jgi:succinoglycan biosynthesis transport protein ExoP